MNKKAGVMLVALVVSTMGCQSTSKSAKKTEKIPHIDKVSVEILLEKAKKRMVSENAIPITTDFKENGTESVVTMVSRDTKQIVSYGSVEVESHPYGVDYGFTVTGECELTTNDKRYESFIRVNGVKINTLAACIPAPAVEKALGPDVHFISHLLYTDDARQFLTVEMFYHGLIFAEIDNKMWMFNTDGFLAVYKDASEVAI